jgi:uncharacterized membrane protein
MKTSALLILGLAGACGDGNHTATPDAPAAGSDAAPDATPPPAPEIVFLDYTFAVDITPDGRTALFENLTDHAGVVLYDTVTHEGVEKTSAGDPARDFVTGISQDLRVSGVYGDPTMGALWSEVAGWATHASPFGAGCDQDISSAFDVSDDGKAATGLMWNGCNPQAYRWTDTGGAGTVQLLQALGGFTGGAISNRGTAISHDGKVVAGFAAMGNLDRTPAVWHEDGTGELLIPTLDGSDPNQAPGEVLSMNADGTVLGGTLGFDGFIWTKGTGAALMTRIPDSDPSNRVFPNAITDDGRLVFGGLGDPFFTIPTAFVWSERDGMRALSDLVTAAGLTIPDGTILGNVYGVSGDGTVMVGDAQTSTGIKTFVLRLPPIPR